MLRKDAFEVTDLLKVMVFHFLLWKDNKIHREVSIKGVKYVNTNIVFSSIRSSLFHVLLLLLLRLTTQTLSIFISTVSLKKKRGHIVSKNPDGVLQRWRKHVQSGKTPSLLAEIIYGSADAPSQNASI